MAQDTESRTCPMCGTDFVIPVDRVPSVFAFAASGTRPRCQVTVDGRMIHRCPPGS